MQFKISVKSIKARIKSRQNRRKPKEILFECIENGNHEKTRERNERDYV